MAFGEWGPDRHGVYVSVRADGIHLNVERPTTAMTIAEEMAQDREIMPDAVHFPRANQPRNQPGTKAGVLAPLRATG
jgi:hypothetical protein